MHRLDVAGAQGRVSFDGSAIRLTHKYSKGIPRVINTIADHAMMAGYVVRTHVITGREVKRSLKHLGYIK
jgi:general secretion pathway protein A